VICSVHENLLDFGRKSWKEDLLAGRRRAWKDVVEVSRIEMRYECMERVRVV
jgi:hypothetical protein